MEDVVPTGRRATKSRWVFDVKYKRDGTIERFKARAVLCGYSQQKGFDYSLTFSATLRSTSFRTFCALCAQSKMKIEQLDVSNAFVQADIDTDLWMEPLKGYPSAPGKVLKLKKALYGAKQSSALWQQMLFKYLTDGDAKDTTFKFNQCASDSCIFEYSSSAGKLLVGVYVDDIIVGYSNKAQMQEFTNLFTKRFPSRSLGPLSYFLGIAVDQHSDGSNSINQTQYIRTHWKGFA